MSKETTTANNRDSHQCPDPGAPGRGDHRLGWPKLDREAGLAAALTLGVLAVATVPRLPPGVCFSDPGDLQLASATLGVMHPPGYPGYATLGYLVTRLPGVDPAYMVSLACLGSGLIALTLCILVQVRLGVSPWIASALCLALAGHRRVWTNLVVPEVYGPTLAFLAAAAYFLIKYARLGQRRSLLVAAALFGIALANRPTVVWTLPFFFAAWWLARKRWSPLWRRWRRTFLWAVLCAALPGLYSLGYLWVRDTPQTPYNYMEHHNAESHELPDAQDGWQAKLKRVFWLASAREFWLYTTGTWRAAWLRLRWLYAEFFLYRPVLCAIVLFLLGLGAVLVYSRCRPSFWLLAGMAIGNVAFICTYRIYGLAADLLPLMFAATVFGGVALSPLFPPRESRVPQAKSRGGKESLGNSCTPPLKRWATQRRPAAVVLWVVICVVTVIQAPRHRLRSPADAVPFITELDMQTLPDQAVICSTWRESIPLWYAKHVLTKRTDIDIINTTPNRWLERIASLPDRPVFVVTKSSYLTGNTLTPYRNLWWLRNMPQTELSTSGSNESGQ